MRYLGLEEVIYIYTEIIHRTGGQAGIADEELLQNILTKPLTSFEGEELYPDLFAKTAVLMYGMITGRPFIGGNDRAAAICALFLLRINGYHVAVTQDNLLDLIKGINDGRYKVDHLAAWFHRHAQPL